MTPADLTPRQIAVAALIARAVPDKRMAVELKLSERMIRVHITAIAYLIGADPELNTRTQIALWYREHIPITVDDVA